MANATEETVTGRNSMSKPGIVLKNRALVGGGVFPIQKPRRFQCCDLGKGEAEAEERPDLADAIPHLLGRECAFVEGENAQDPHARQLNTALKKLHAGGQPENRKRLESAHAFQLCFEHKAGADKRGVKEKNAPTLCSFSVQRDQTCDIHRAEIPIAENRLDNENIGVQAIDLVDGPAAASGGLQQRSEQGENFGSLEIGAE